MNSNEELVEYLVGRGILKDVNIIRAMSQIDRKDFVGEGNLDRAYIDNALPIKFSQTISQPSTVAFMLEELGPEEGQKILDVGSGSGWTTAILAKIIGEKGKVIACEIIPQIKKLGEENVDKYHFKNVKFYEADASIGLKKEAPFDRILCSAAASEMPERLKSQLNLGGRLVIPVGGINGQSIMVVEKVGEKTYKQKKYPGFVFVELRGKYKEG